MIELLKRLAHLKQAQSEALDVMQKTSGDMQLAVAALEAALKAIEAGLGANSTALAYMMSANQKALAELRGDEDRSDR